jgi:hypothetical protein
VTELINYLKHQLVTIISVVVSVIRREKGCEMDKKLQTPQRFSKGLNKQTEKDEVGMEE